MDTDYPSTGGWHEPLLEVRMLSRRYVRGTWYSPNRFRVIALDNVSLTVQPHSSLALIGESGAGKSTLARCLVGLEEPDTGEIWFEGKELSSLPKPELSAARRRIQLIFQDSATSLNPRFSAVEIIEEPLRLQTRTGKRQRRAMVLEMMEKVGLSPQWADRSPLEFSSGQRQRLSIARALIQKPAFLILDEALSGLDLSTQAQIINLLLDFQASFSLTYLFITHDIRVAGYFADNIAVMQAGKIVEYGPAAAVISHPQTSQARLLVAAIPGLRADSTGPH
jgi:ABC-type glutathione transport system ATPase component